MPECKRGNTAHIVTATKQSKEPSEEGSSQNKSSVGKNSSEEENSAGSDLSEIQVKTSTLSSTSTTLPSMTDSRLDTKMEHLLTHYFLAVGDGHEV